MLVLTTQASFDITCIGSFLMACSKRRNVTFLLHGWLQHWEIKQQLHHPPFWILLVSSNTTMLYKIPSSSTQQKKLPIHLYMAFLYNSCIPDLSYTTLYTVVCKKNDFSMTFMYQSFTKTHIYRIVYCIWLFLLTNTKHIPIVLMYASFILFVENIDLSQIMWIVILIKKLHNIIRYAFHTPMMWSLCYYFLS